MHHDPSKRPGKQDESNTEKQERNLSPMHSVVRLNPIISDKASQVRQAICRYTKSGCEIPTNTHVGSVKQQQQPQTVQYVHMHVVKQKPDDITRCYCRWPNTIMKSGYASIEHTSTIRMTFAIIFQYKAARPVDIYVYTIYFQLRGKL